MKNSIEILFVEWIKKTFEEYKIKTFKTVDLDYREYEYCAKVYTQRQIIDLIIQLSDKVLKNCNDYYETIDEIIDLFKLVIYDMWW